MKKLFKPKLGIKARLFFAVAGAALLIWLVTMGVLTALTYQRIVEDAEEKIGRLRGDMRSVLESLVYGDTERLENYLEEQTLPEQFMDVLQQLAWPGGYKIGGGHSITFNGNPDFSGAARIVCGDVEVQSGNYLRLYHGEGGQFYYLPLDGVFSTADVERLLEVHKGSLAIESWPRGEAMGYLDKGLFWADELVFYNKDGTEDRYAAVKPQSGGAPLHITFNEWENLGGSMFFTAAKSREAQATLARNLAALDLAPSPGKAEGGYLMRRDGLLQKELWYTVLRSNYDADSREIELLGYATYFPVSMMLQELWRIYLFTFLAAVVLALFFSVRVSKRFGVPVADLYATVRDNAPAEHYRIKSGIRELDDLGESLARLTQAEKEAKWKAQEDLKREQDLTRAVAHELKTPLAILRSHAEALSEDIDPAKREQYLSIIMDESDRMAALVGELLDLSRMEAGAERLNREVVNLKTLTERVFAPLQNLAHVSLNLASLTVSGDPKLLERAVSNYASNALRHVREGGEIRVTLRREGGNAVLTVENDGDPIPPEALPHLWDTFYKADTARTRTGGTGLGLAIVRSIAALHGGSCAAENRPVGVAFTLTIPAEKGGE